MLSITKFSAVNSTTRFAVSQRTSQACSGVVPSNPLPQFAVPSTVCSKDSRLLRSLPKRYQSRNLTAARVIQQERSVESEICSPSRISAISLSDNGFNVEIHFEDGTRYIFHSLWLRDACRDERFLKSAAGERILALTPLVEGCDVSNFRAERAETVDGGDKALLAWNDGHSGALDASFLKAYAPQVAETIETSCESSTGLDVSWLEPYMSGTCPAPTEEQLSIWAGPDGEDFLVMPYEKAITPEGNLELIQRILRHGAVKVTGAPDPGEERLRSFVYDCFGGLQKDPSRAEANWKIVRKEGAASVSYNPTVRLNNHTDQSLPNHGIPALLLAMHYAEGWGANTFVDGFAVAKALKERNPRGFELLTKYGNNQERDLLASRQDASQNHTDSMYLTSVAPIIQLDDAGEVKRIQYNEVFRTPATVPYSLFTEWYEAYLQFGTMLHSPEFEREMPMSEGDFFIMNNWRVLHGRAGSHDGSGRGRQSPNRVLVGGTVTRESVFSKARALLLQLSPVPLHGPTLLS